MSCDAYTLAAIRERLNRALRASSTRSALRSRVVELSADLEDAELAQSAPPTLRAPVGYPAPWHDADDVAPSTDRGSASGQEFGE